MAPPLLVPAPLTVTVEPDTAAAHAAMTGAPGGVPAWLTRKLLAVQKFSRNAG
jgi:hypothetical protein